MPATSKLFSRIAQLAAITALSASAVAAQSLSPTEARAIAKEAYVYGRAPSPPA